MNFKIYQALKMNKHSSTSEITWKVKNKKNQNFEYDIKKFLSFLWNRIFSSSSYVFCIDL